MKIKVRLFANLRAKLPARHNGQEAEVEVPDGATPQMVIAQLEIPPELAHLVMVNGFHLLKEDIRERQLLPGEVLSIFPPIAGGRG